MKFVKESQTITLRLHLTEGELEELRQEWRTLDAPYGGGIPAAPWQNPPKWPMLLSLLSALVRSADGDE